MYVRSNSVTSVRPTPPLRAAPVIITRVTRARIVNSQSSHTQHNPPPIFIQHAIPSIAPGSSIRTKRKFTHLAPSSSASSDFRQTSSIPSQSETETSINSNSSSSISSISSISTPSVQDILQSNVTPCPVHAPTNTNTKTIVLQHHISREDMLLFSPWTFHMEHDEIYNNSCSCSSTPSAPCHTNNNSSSSSINTPSVQSVFDRFVQHASQDPSQLDRFLFDIYGIGGNTIPHFLVQNHATYAKMPNGRNANDTNSPTKNVLNGRKVLFLDYDNTILCHDFWYQYFTNPLVLLQTLRLHPNNIMLSRKDSQYFQSVDESICKVLMDCCLGYKQVFLVTNATAEWVYYTSKYFLPKFHSFCVFDDAKFVVSTFNRYHTTFTIKVVSARDLFAENMPTKKTKKTKRTKRTKNVSQEEDEDVIRWKTFAFHYCLSLIQWNLDEEYLMYIQSIGDSFEELVAGWTLKDYFSAIEIYLDCLKSSPTPEDILKQIQLFSKLLN